MNPSHPFILRPIATTLLMIAFLLSGLLAYQLLPVSSLPEVDYPTIQVATFYPGASPDVTASYITAPLERQFGQMPSLNQMTSTSSTGASIITLQFSLELGLDVAEQEVQAAINAATTFLPPNLPNPPIYSKVNPADAPILTIALTSKTLPLFQVEDYADTRLTQKISQLTGVGLVSISGGQRPAVRIQVNPDALASLGINLESVRSAIAAGNVNAAKGNFDGPRLSYIINSNDQLLSAEDYKPLIIAYNNNAPVRLSDISYVVNDVENVHLAAWMNTTPAVILNIQRQPGSNVIAVADRIKKLLTQLQATLPTAIEVHILTDRTTAIRASVQDVQFELLLSVALVVLVIFLFLRNLPATFIPSIAVPLSLIGTLGAMYLFGFSLNNLTLMGLTIATGFVVDDAIVMVENISRYLEQGESPLQAALKGSAQIGFTIMSLTLSLIAVLIPLLFMSDLIGRLFREFAITLSVTVLISAFVSLTLTPMLCSRLLRHHKVATEENRYERAVNHFQENVILHYKKTLGWVLDHQPLTLIIAGILLFTTAILFYIIPKGFFPIQDTGVIQAISEASQTISFPAMVDRQQALANIVLQDPAVDNISSIVGIDGVNTTLNSGRMLITLKPLGQRDAGAIEIIRRLQPKFDKVVGAKLYMQPIQSITIDDRISRNQYQYSVGSASNADVEKWTRLLVNQLQSISILRDVTSDQQNLGLKTRVTIDRDTASRLGISAQMIDDTLYDAFGQRQVSTMFTQRNQYHVILETFPKLHSDTTAFSHLYINSATNNRAIPFGVFTQISQEVGPLVVYRQGQFPVSTISFNLASNASLGDAIKSINEAKQELKVPDIVAENKNKIF